MGKKGTMFYGAMLLTGANLLLRVVSLGFQVYLSGRVGAAGVGLLQLTSSVCLLAMTAAMAGIRTAAMYLTAEELGRGHCGGTGAVLSACFRYSIFCSVLVGTRVYFAAPHLASVWVGNPDVLTALRIFAAFLPVTCLTGVFTGYYTAVGRYKTLVAIEVAEQLLSMVLTLTFLSLRTVSTPGSACTCIIGGSSVAGMGSLIGLMLMKGPVGKEKPSLPIAPRLARTALPLAFADILRMGISTAENLIVPRRLALFSGSSQALAAYGMVCGMVFPILMFPASILYSLAELLIPELSRSHAGGKRRRISYLTARSLRVALLYGLLAGGVLFASAPALGAVLYRSREVGELLKIYSLLAPMLYLDAITDAVTKGMGQQVACVRYNTITSFLDVVFLWLLLPRFGLEGYFFSFAVTHGLNFLLSFRRLMKATGFRPRLHLVLKAYISWGFATLLVQLLPLGESLGAFLLSGVLYVLLFLLLAGFLGVVGKEDVLWLRNLVKPKKSH